MRRLVLTLCVCVLAGVVGAPVAGAAVSWCGASTSADLQPDLAGGRSVHVIYAIPSDGPDRFASWASKIATDVESIDAWWQREDPSRAPRFDLADFAGCPSRMGKLDISTVRLAASSADLRPLENRLQKIGSALASAGFTLSAKKYLVYYDGPSDDSLVCGQSPLAPEIGGFFANAGIYMQSRCDLAFGTSGSGAATAAHELLHNLGAVADSAPHKCPPERNGHVCEDGRDVMWPFVNDSLFNTILDVNHDDYYAHNGSWWDVQDSTWLRRPTETLTLGLTIGLNGGVDVGQPSVDFITSCLTSCTTEWDAGSEIMLTAAPAEGYGVSSWGDQCGREPECPVTLSSALTLTPTFAKEFMVTIRVKGQGRVRGPGFVCAKTCQRFFLEGDSLTLRAEPRKGSTFTRWAGDCKGAKRCTVTAGTRNKIVTASFAKAKPKAKPKRKG